MDPATAAKELLTRRQARAEFHPFIRYTFPRYRENWHHGLVADRLQAVADGRIKRLMVNLPPRHSKTEFVSRRLAAFWLGLRPDDPVIGCSYSADVAHRVNREIQRIMTQASYRRLFPATRLAGEESTGRLGSWRRSASEFEVVGRAGSYTAAGIGGPITGKGFKLGIVDDPFKNAEEADSEVYRNRVWDWWLSTFLTRDEGDAAVVCTFTRWHEDDLAGRILEEAKTTGEHWEVLNLEALRSEDEGEPEDPRKPGEALWPAKMSAQALERIRARRDRWWHALYQQRPQPLEGAILKRDAWKFYEPGDAPPFFGKVHSWDTAHSKKETSARSVCSVWGLAETGAYLLDVWKDKVEFPELKAQAEALGARDNPAYVLIEDKASGKDLIPELRRGTRLPIVPVTPTTDKVARAHAAAGLIASGRVFLPRGAPFLADYLDETAGFPSGKYADQVDSTTQFLTWWRDVWQQPRQRVIANKPGTFRRRPF